MIHTKSLPLNLWAEAVNCAAYVLNRIPSSRNKTTTPFEIWNGHKPNLSHLRIFGSEVFVHAPKQRRKKWDKKSVKQIFVGYHNDSSNYRVYDPVTKRISTSRDVNFIEETSSGNTLSEDEITLPFGDDIQANPTQPGDTEDADDSASDPEIDDNVKVETENESSKNPRVLRDRAMLKQPVRYEANIVELNIPQSYEEAITGRDADEWKCAIKEELQAHRKNKTWSLVKLPKHRKTISVINGSSK